MDLSPGEDSSPQRGNWSSQAFTVVPTPPHPLAQAIQVQTRNSDGTLTVQSAQRRISPPSSASFHAQAYNEIAEMKRKMTKLENAMLKLYKKLKTDKTK